jgi:hypothetical protein
MNNKIDIINLQEEYPEFFEVFSSELIEFALSKEISQKIANICIENKITEKDLVEGIAFRITYVIFEKLPKENFIITLKDGLEIGEEKAKKISESVDKMIFSEMERIKNKKDENIEKPPIKEEKPKIINEGFKKDVYREPIG